MIQHFTLTANVHEGETPEGTTYLLMAVSEERNEKWASGPLTPGEYRKSLQNSQLSDEQIEAPIRTAQQMQFKAQDGKDMLFIEDELRKMKLQRIPAK